MSLEQKIYAQYQEEVEFILLELSERKGVLRELTVIAGELGMTTTKLPPKYDLIAEFQPVFVKVHP